MKDELTWHRANHHAMGHAHCAVHGHVLGKHGKEQESPIDPTTEPLDTPADQTAVARRRARVHAEVVGSNFAAVRLEEQHVTC